VWCVIQSKYTIARQQVFWYIIIIPHYLYIYNKLFKGSYLYYSAKDDDGDRRGPEKWERKRDYVIIVIIFYCQRIKIKKWKEKKEINAWTAGPCVTGANSLHARDRPPALPSARPLEITARRMFANAYTHTLYIYTYVYVFICPFERGPIETRISSHILS